MLNISYSIVCGIDEEKTNSRGNLKSIDKRSKNNNIGKSNWMNSIENVWTFNAFIVSIFYCSMLKVQSLMVVSFCCFGCCCCCLNLFFFFLVSRSIFFLGCNVLLIVVYITVCAHDKSLSVANAKCLQAMFAHFCLCFVFGWVCVCELKHHVFMALFVVFNFHLNFHCESVKLWI